jgi:hypothetical protein
MSRRRVACTNVLTTWFCSRRDNLRTGRAQLATATPDGVVGCSPTARNAVQLATAPAGVEPALTDAGREAPPSNAHVSAQSPKGVIGRFVAEPCTLPKLKRLKAAELRDLCSQLGLEVHNTKLENATRIFSLLDGSSSGSHLLVSSDDGSSAAQGTAMSPAEPGHACTADTLEPITASPPQESSSGSLVEEVQGDEEDVWTSSRIEAEQQAQLPPEALAAAAKAMQDFLANPQSDMVAQACAGSTVRPRQALE